MLHASLRRSGGSFIMTFPLSYVEQNHLARVPNWPWSARFQPVSQSKPEAPVF